MQRTAIIITKQLNRGQAANTAAILMGQMALLRPHLYDANPVKDADGNNHAAVQYSIVLLEANGAEQVINFMTKISTENPALVACLFSQEGQALNNAFEQYRELLSAKKTSALIPVGAVISGDDAEVRAATKKFSLLR